MLSNFLYLHINASVVAMYLIHMCCVYLVYMYTATVAVAKERGHWAIARAHHIVHGATQ